MPARRFEFFRVAYWVAVAALFAWAGWLRFSLPLDPLADPDTWGYLSPALNELLGAGFVQIGRNFVYPGFLFLLLRAAGDFRAITVVQHLFGLVAGGVLLLTWRRLQIFLPKSRPSHGLHAWMGLAAVAIFLVAGEPIRAEMQLRPEAVCAFALSLNLYFAIGFIARAFVEPRRPAVWFGIWTAFTAALLYSLKPSFLFLALVSLAPVGIFFLRRNLFWQKIVLGSGIVIGATLFLLPEYFLSRDDKMARMFLPTTLFVVHADLIRDQMADDLARAAALPYPRDWLSRVHELLSAEIARSAVLDRIHYRSLGFNPDYLMYNENSIVSQFLLEYKDDMPWILNFYRFYYWRTWRQRPWAMMRKIARQMTIFYAPICPVYDQSKTVSLKTWYRLGADSLSWEPCPDVWKAYPPAVEFVQRAAALGQSAPPIEQSRVLRKTLDFLAAAYLPLLASTVAICIALFFWRGERRSLGWLAALALLVFSYNAAACLEVAIINSLEVPRYSTVQFFFTLFAELLAVDLLLQTLARLRRGENGDVPSRLPHPENNSRR